jgi:hypothetical protein
MVIEYKPPDNIVSMPNLYKSDSCPDYWTYEDVDNKDQYGNNVKLTTHSDEEKNVHDLTEVSKIQPNHKSYKCVPNDRIYKDNEKKIRDAVLLGEEDDKFRGYLAYMTNAEDEAGVDSSNVCEHVFPEYLSYLDNERFIKNNHHGDTNHYRCKYAKLCDIPWTGAGCD